MYIIALKHPFVNLPLNRLRNGCFWDIIYPAPAGVAKLVDALALGASGVTRGGSSPLPGTHKKAADYVSAAFLHFLGSNMQEAHCFLS